MGSISHAVDWDVGSYRLSYLKSHTHFPETQINAPYQSIITMLIAL